MNWSADAIVPAVRSKGLVVEHLAGEALIYDLERDEAHQLNPTATAVFDLCDGRATVAAVAELASGRLGQPVTTQTVAEALRELEALDLLDRAAGAGLSRRQAVGRVAAVAGAAAATPLITSIVAPTPAQAASPGCGAPGTDCNNAMDCCEGLACSDECCIQEGDPCVRDAQDQDECCNPSLSCEPEGPNGSFICVD